MLPKDNFEKCLLITGAFEGASWGGAIGNFDGAGISAFILQWNLGQGTLQPLLMDMYQTDPSRFDIVAGKENSKKICNMCLTPDKEDIQAFITEITVGNSYQAPVGMEDKHFKGGKLIKPEWVKIFSNIGISFKQQQISNAKKYFDSAFDLCKKFDLHTERGLAFCFDYAVQRGAGSLNDEYLEKQRIKQEYDKLNEIQRMNWILINDLPDFSVRWRKDVNSRRLCIINGEGWVHSTHYNLKDDFGLTDVPF